MWPKGGLRPLVLCGSSHPAKKMSWPVVFFLILKVDAGISYSSSSPIAWIAHTTCAYTASRRLFLRFMTAAACSPGCVSTWLTSSTEAHELLSEPRPPRHQNSVCAPVAMSMCGRKKSRPMSSAKSRVNPPRSSWASSGSASSRVLPSCVTALTAV